MISLCFCYIVINANTSIIVQYPAWLCLVASSNATIKH